MKDIATYYLHVCNSGTTFGIREDDEGNAEIFVRSGFFGLGSTELVCRGRDYPGVKAAQLRGIAAAFLEAADYIEHGKPVEVKERPVRIANQAAGSSDDSSVKKIAG